MEFRIAPYGLIPQPRFSLEIFLESLRRGIKRASAAFPHTLTRIIISIGRRSICEKWPLHQHDTLFARLISIASLFRDIVVGFDLSGDEDLYPNSNFVPFSKKLKSAGFRLTIHAGETNRPASIWEAINLLNADRIGHGIGARFDPSLMKYLASSQIPLELCPTANWLLGNISSPQDHPFGLFYRNGLLVTVNTDNPVIFHDHALNRSTSLSGELLQLLECHHISVDDLPSIFRNSIVASFMDSDHKRLMLSAHKVGSL